jgi:4-aminobutyrate aminotransferase-like enzyme
MDFFTTPGTEVLAVLDGEIVAVSKTGEDTAVVLQHEPVPGQIRFFSIYRYLSPESVQGLEAGQKVGKGDQLGDVGDSILPPHLHFQFALDLLDYGVKLPGASTPDERHMWTSICPDPNLVLQVPRHRFPPTGKSVSEILDVRRDSIGRSLSIAYKRPLKIVRGCGQYLYDEDGRAFLDGVNNVCHVGHCHPKVVEAARRQMTVLNTNTRYLHDNLVNYAERLCSTMPDPLSVCFFVCSGSEANELALRLARSHSGGTDFIVVDGAYHGNTTSLVEISPYKFDGPGGKGAPNHVHKVPMPDAYRGPYRGMGDDIGGRYAVHAGEALDHLKKQGRKPAAFICESLLGCGGQIVLPDGYMKEAFRHVRQAGAVCIADEVQVGFGRVGTHFWGFETQDAVPDIVTLGKPIGNGHPLGAVITTPEIAASFVTGMEYFNTFGGNPVSCAIGMAVLDVIEYEMLQQNALEAGKHLLNRLNELKEKYAIIGDVRGLGLFIGVEMVLDRESLKPATEYATYVINRMKDHGILLSTDGPLENVLKIKPPIVFTRENADFLVETLDSILNREVRI